MNLEIRTLDKWGLSFKDYMMIAGPCSVENEEQVMQTVQALEGKHVDMIRGGIWKPRTRPNTFEGVGEPALKWLKAAGNALNLPVTCEVAKPEHIESCLKHDIDVLWIGARTTSNPFAVQAIADRLRGVDIPVFVKNPVNPELALWMGALERMNAVGIRRLGAIHRGFSTFDTTIFRNHPFWTIPIELRRIAPEVPLICDPSHISGKSELVESVAQTALDLLFDGLMIEVHINPPNALSDAEQQLTPDHFHQVATRLKIKKLSSDNQDYLTNMRILREEIDRIDAKIVELLSKRMEISQTMGVHKSKNTISTFQPDRWNDVLKHALKIAEKKNLPENFILNIYRQIHEESIRRQVLIHHKKGEK